MLSVGLFRLNTPLIAYPDASVVRLKSLEKSGYCRIDFVISAVFTLLNAFSWSYDHLKGISFFNSCVNGFAILEKLGINLL